MKVVKVEISAQPGHYYMPFDQAAGTVEAELDSAEVGDSVTLTVEEMTKEKYESMPEFMGW